MAPVRRSVTEVAHVLTIDTQGQGGVTPRIAIYQHPLLCEQRQPRTHIDGRGGFPGAPLMIGAGNDPRRARGSDLWNMRRSAAAMPPILGQVSSSAPL